MDGMKLCSSCAQVKPFSDFYQFKGKPHGTKCKKCQIERMSEYQKKNRDKNNEAVQRWREKNPEKNKQMNKDYKIRNPHKVKEHKIKQDIKRKENPEKSREWALAWKKRNPERNTYNSQNYRAAKLRAMPKWMNEGHLAEIWGHYLYSSIFGTVVDHIVPLRSEEVCGLHVPWNLQPLTFSENSSKHNRLIDTSGLVYAERVDILNLERLFASNPQ